MNITVRHLNWRLLQAHRKNKILTLEITKLKRDRMVHIQQRRALRSGARRLS